MDLTSGKMIKQFHVSSGHTGVSKVQFTADGKLLLAFATSVESIFYVLSRDPESEMVSIYDTHTFENITVLPGATVAALSPNERVLASFSPSKLDLQIYKLQGALLSHLGMENLMERNTQKSKTQKKNILTFVSEVSIVTWCKSTQSCGVYDNALGLI